MLTLPQKVGLGNAQQVLGALTEAMQAAPAQASLELDAAALLDFDSAVLAVLLECQRRAQASGRRLTLVGAPPKLAELARVFGLSELLWPEATAA
ncbi:MAG: STAS domain-containing protein [Burkholderiaceae bacterium]|nr:STAS domain-containing protein [Burkholderiaceae bacterium]MBT9500427.1 STAS domain-containing protein [Burkholderiaceae bacterium]